MRPYCQISTNGRYRLLTPLKGIISLSVAGILAIGAVSSSWALESQVSITSTGQDKSNESQNTPRDVLKLPQNTMPNDVMPKNIMTEALTPTELSSAGQITAMLKESRYPIDLQTVLKLAEEQNLSIAQGLKNTEILTSRYRQRQVSLLPSIDGTFNQSKLTGAQQVFGDNVTIVRKTVQPQLSISWTVYPGGQTIYEILAAKRRTEAAKDQYLGSYQEQLSLAAQDYYKLIAAYQQKNVLSGSLAQAKAQIEVNQAKVDAGKGIPLDLSRAKTSYAQQQTSLVQAENAIIQAEQSLLNRLNLDSTIHLSPPGELLEANDVVQIEALQKPLLDGTERATDTQGGGIINQLLALAVENNPNIKAMQEELKALGHDYGATRSQLVPSLTFRAYKSLNGSSFNSLMPTEFGGVSVNMNLLENMGLQIPFQMQERKKIIEQKQLEEKQLLRDIENQVMSAHLSSENYKSVIASAKQEVNSAQESYDLAVGRFNAGYGINIDVIDAQAALVTAKNNLVQAILNYNQAQTQLAQAIGMATPENILNGIHLASEGISSRE